VGHFCGKEQYAFFKKRKAFVASYGEVPEWAPGGGAGRAGAAAKGGEPGAGWDGAAGLV
jgi:hypothetical protein